MLTDEVHGLLAPIGDAEPDRGAGRRGCSKTPTLARRLALAACDTTERWRGSACAIVGSPSIASCAPHPFSSRGPGRMSSDAPLETAAAMDRHELWFRASTAGPPAGGTRRLRGAPTAMASGPRWRTHCAPTNPSTRPAIACLQRGDWLGAHEALMHHFATRRPRFVLDPAARSAAGPHDPRAASRRARRCDPTRRSGGRGQVRSPRLQGPVVWQRRRARTIDWHLDPVHRRRAPQAYWSRVPYLEPSCGDHKVVWELNRHQSWLTLGRAYWLTDDERYRDGLHRAPR